jgi:hypothetical protein
MTAPPDPSPATKPVSAVRRRFAANNYRLPFGALVAKSLQVYFGNLVPFVLLAAMTLGPWIVLRFYTEYGLAWHEMTRGEVTTYSALLSLLDGLGTHLLTGALTFGVVQKLRGLPAGLDQILGFGVKSFLTVLAVGIVTGLLIGLGMLVIVPGLMLMTVWYVAMPAAVLERRGVGAAMQRSSDLTRGSRWPIFGAALLFLVLTVGSIWLLEWVYGDAGTPAWLDVLVNVLLTPFGATMPAVCYFLLRTGKENIDAKAIAAVFD